MLSNDKLINENVFTNIDYIDFIQYFIEEMLPFD